MQGAALPEGCKVSGELMQLIRSALQQHAGHEELPAEGSVALDVVDKREFDALQCDTEKDNTYR